MIALAQMSGPHAMRQMPLDLGPRCAAGLDEFIAGANAQALAWFKAWPWGPTSSLPGVYLWGPSGSGKTHLLRALVPKALERGYSVIWISAQACQTWDAHDPAAPTLALIDGCQELDGHLQHLAFNLFIEAAGAGANGAGGPLSIVATGALPAVDLPLRDDLRSRLGWGLIFALSPLDEEGVRQALQAEAARRGLRLGEGVLPYLLSRHRRDLGSLMSLLDRLDRFALAEHRTVTVPLLKQMLALETP